MPSQFYVFTEYVTKMLRKQLESLRSVSECGDKTKEVGWLKLPFIRKMFLMLRLNTPVIKIEKCST